MTETAGQLPEEHPPYDVWCTADEDFIFLKGEVGGYMQTYYELMEMETTTGSAYEGGSGD